MLQTFSEYVTFPKFWNDFVLKHVPEAQIRFRKNNWFWRYLPKRKSMVCTIGNTVWFYSVAEFNSLAKNGTLEPILGHEFMHLWQKKTGEINWFLYGWPQTSVLILILWAIFSGPWSFLVLVILAFSPFYGKYRIDAECAAYKMELLIEMARFRGFPISIVSDWFCGDVIRFYRILFSRTHWCMATPGFIKRKYFEDLRDFFGNILNALDRLAYVKENSYITSVSGIYAEVLRYYFPLNNR